MYISCHQIQQEFLSSKFDNLDLGQDGMSVLCKMAGLHIWKVCLEDNRGDLSSVKAFM